MDSEHTGIKKLRTLMLGEIFRAFGFAKDGWARRNLWPLFWLPAHTFSKFSLGFDEIVARDGFDAACRWVIPRFVKDTLSFGNERIPAEGPVLIASNHPGSVDALAIAANVHRPDFRIIVSSIPFIMNLPHTAKHMIYTTRDTVDRMAVLRASVNHLKNGGAILTYPSGNVDPDPAVLPGAEEGLDRWSRSVELLLRKVPETQLVIAIVSNVVGSAYYRNPIIKLQKGYREKQKLAEFIQMMQQMVFPGTVNVVPRVSFDSPVQVEKLMRSADDTYQIMQSINTRARTVLKDHMTCNFANLECNRA